MDEADRILNMDFEVEVDKILKCIPRERRTYLYSATMTKKVGDFAIYIRRPPSEHSSLIWVRMRCCIMYVL